VRAVAPSPDEPMVEWALYWASRGWLVFPLCSPLMGEHKHKRDDTEPCLKDIGKAPMIGNGFKGGSVDPTQIRSWWSKWPLANIGSTPPKGHAVVDIDGETDVEFPETRSHTSGKGQHLLFRDTEGRVPQGNRIWPNVDIRVHDKGYVVLPPSLHVSGTRYAVQHQCDPIPFPYALLPAKAKTGGGGKGASKLAQLLAKPIDDPDTGDDWFAQVCGHIAHIARTEDEYVALIERLNLSLADPLSTTSMGKKHGIWQAEQSKPERQTDEERGWLIESTDSTGYSTVIGKGDSLELVVWSDFRVQAKGLIKHPDNQTWIIDFHLSDGSILENVKMDASIMANTGKLTDFLMRRGMAIFPHQADKRGSHGARMLKMLQSQKAPILVSRDYYGWCVETNAFLINTGEVDATGLRSFTEAYPLDNLVKSCPVKYGFDADIDQVRNWLDRLMQLQDPTETAKMLSWMMMLMLRDQWSGLLPGLLVEAFAGVGKTTFFKLFSALAGVPQDGENMTLPTARDMLSGHSSGFIWLDDVAADERMEQLVRKAITQGREVLKSRASGDWTTEHKDLRGSVIISGEGVDFYRQKAIRDRFVNVEFKRNPSTDAEVLLREDVGSGAGTLLMEVLRYADRLPELEEELRSSAKDRVDQVRATMCIGARILDLVMGTDNVYTRLVDGWYSGGAVEADLGNASVGVLHVFPTMWAGLTYPNSGGENGVVMPLWYDETSETFWINCKKVSTTWLHEQRNLSLRDRQLSTQTNLNKELDACEATGSVAKRVGDTVVRYRQLPHRYSQMVHKLATNNE
jgi:hypothetical protein